MLLQAELNLIFLFKIPFFCSAASLEADPVTCVYIWSASRAYKEKYKLKAVTCPLNLTVLACNDWFQPGHLTLPSCSFKQAQQKL